MVASKWHEILCIYIVQVQPSIGEKVNKPIISGATQPHTCYAYLFNGKFK